MGLQCFDTFYAWTGKAESAVWTKSSVGESTNRLSSAEAKDALLRVSVAQ